METRAILRKGAGLLEEVRCGSLEGCAEWEGHVAAAAAAGGCPRGS